MDSVIQIDEYKIGKVYQEYYEYYKDPMSTYQKKQMEKAKKEIRSAMVSGYMTMLSDQIK